MPTLPMVLHSPLVWVAVIPIGFLTLLFFVALFERHLTAPYIPASSPSNEAPGLNYAHETPNPSQVSEYVSIMGAAAEAAGFEYGGMLAHAQVPKTKILATLWMSPQRETLVLSGSGTVINLPSRQTWIYTPIKDGQFVVTTDNNDAGDHSGLYRVKRVLNAPFHELLAAHLKRLESMPAQIDAFREKTAAQSLQVLYDRRVQRMIERGVARFTGPDGLYWSYTLNGALRVCANFFVQLGAALPQTWTANRQPVGSTNLRN